MKKTPTIYVIGGPNGSGKTTFAMEFLPKIAGCRNFINADLIAGGLSPLDVDAAAIRAGRIFLGQIEENVREGRSFAFETTLSGLSYLGLLRRVQRKGYQIRLFFLWIPTVELALKRIAERVRRGGHDIPEATARRRYGKGLRNLFQHYLAMASYCAVFDNSSADPVLVYERKPGRETVLQPAVFERMKRQAGITR
ncbi:MAG: AAA family ATPase [Verrucomicrobiota bacterium]